MSKHAHAEIIPINFRLTPRASWQFIALASELSLDERPMVLTVLWAEAYDEIKKCMVPQGIALAGMYRDDVPEAAIAHIDGVDLYFAVSRAQSENFRGKTIDYENNRVFFLP